MKQAPIPDVVMHVTPRLISNDCATWALSVLTGRGYPEVKGQAAKVDKGAGKDGLSWAQLKRMATRMGLTLLFRKTVNLDEDTGILGVEFPDGVSHAVVLMQGPVIIDADNTVWQADAYIAAKQVQVDSILVLKEAK